MAIIPVLAIMGSPNAGKSSVVATLTENDRIDIDQRSGTTTRSDHYPVLIDGQPVIEFIDTPGFQNPSHILEWFQQHPQEPNLAAAFVLAHQHDALFAHDCALLEPVATGAGVILVIDGSKRIKEKDRTEMELLRLTGRPRMAILNNLTTHNKYLHEWQDTLNKSFNSVREFNAHRATYAERLSLLNALKSIDQRWEPQLDATITAFQRDWERRIEQSVTTIITLLTQALTLRVTHVVRVAEVRAERERQSIQTRLQQQFQDQLRQLESAAQQEIRTHFRHHVWQYAPDSLLNKDLFSHEVGTALGLNRTQRMMIGAAAGATAGVGIDVSLVGASLGIGLLIGATTGGVLGALGGMALAKLDIQRTLGVERFVFGPVTHPQFPFILLDRIILYCAKAMNWSHGRKAADETALYRVPDKLIARQQGFTAELTAAQQKMLLRFFTALRQGRESPDATLCHQLIADLLLALSENRVDNRLNL